MSRYKFDTLDVILLAAAAMLAAAGVFFVVSAVSAPAYGAVPDAAHAAEHTVIPERSARYRLAIEREAAANFGLQASAARLASQIHQESAWDPQAASPYAQGLAQVTPDTAAWLPTVCPRVGTPDAWDAQWSIRAMACYDAWLYARVNGADGCERMAFALAAYNAGLGWVQRDRARTSASGADASRWFDSVEMHSARAASARAETSGYVRRILLTLEPAYLAAGWSGQKVCL